MDAELQFIHDLVKPLRVKPGAPVKLRDFDPEETRELKRSDAAAHLEAGIALLVEYQARLAAEATRGVLLVLQGMDASGKDGTIKHVMSGVNPQGVEVHSFKQPSAEELAHDFLWRYQRAIPGRGRIGVFNRSHYEEVLVVRVHPELLAAELAASRGPDVWKQRYRDINAWEQALTDGGWRIVKICLNLSKREQAKRFLSRIDDPSKNWKFNEGDVHERQFWDSYQKAFDEMLSHTSTQGAPWHVVPADEKWFTRLATAAVLVHALADLDPQYPKLDPALRPELARARAVLVDEAGP